MLPLSFSKIFQYLVIHVNSFHCHNIVLEFARFRSADTEQFRSLVAEKMVLY